ncbi:hypothetical protein O3G_MSEX011367 [Manduca sexta]|uniref:Uncharacterized protein n=1 Tax=Manduca sexta TaxID=7130 RepID=A0A922CV18_MANSE|nr:hypothetical protein O3G_MSEX011367 [Manduca sexta]
MNIFSFSIIFVLFVNVILSKDLHVKENFELKDRDNSISDLTYGYDVLPNNERFVRHVELVTESVVEHLMKEIKKRYPNSTRNNSSNLLQRLRIKLQKRVNKKNKKLRKKQKFVNKANNVTKLP